MHATLLHIGGDSSRVVGSALCKYAAKVKATVLVIMKESKSAVQVSPRHTPCIEEDADAPSASWSSSLASRASWGN